MLEPEHRTLLSDALRPPPGMQLDHAVVTTFTLDLTAALTVPLAFAGARIADDPEPMQLLEALRSSTERLDVFYQGGAVTVPPGGANLVALIEETVHPVRRPRPGHIFHPKVWALRFVDEHGQRRFRLLVSSRNLTSDHSWDALLLLEGKPSRTIVPENEPLVRFVASLPALAGTRLDQARAEAVATMASDLRRVSWELPEGVTDIAFHPLGVPGMRSRGLDRLLPGARHLMISPFVTAQWLQGMSLTDEVDQWLQSELPAFLTDPNMQVYHRSEQGIIADLALHLSATPDRDALHAQRTFKESDLRFSEATESGNINRFAERTRFLLSQLHGNEALRARAVELLNANLEAAAAHMLGFSGDELVVMMRDVRKHLAAQGKELILLFEDFANAQGIDGALLEALRDDSGSAGSERGTLRSMVAVTTGYYTSRFADTDRDRVNIVVNMNERRLGTDGVDESGVARFAARYLNALRVPKGDLAMWYEYGRAEGDPLPNGCDDCAYRDECHATFRSVSIEGVGEIGLYPFSPDSLHNMVERRELNERFNPRALLEHVLKPICEAPRARDLEEGRFPDQSLVMAFGGMRLPLALQTQVRAQHGGQSERYLSVLELWTRDPSSPTVLPEGLYTAFGLLPLAVDLARPAAPTAPSPTAADGQPQQSSHALPTDPRLESLRRWGNRQEQLAQLVANDVREALWEAMNAFIPWDDLGLSPTLFSGRGTGTRPFHPRSFRIRDALTAPPHVGVSIQVPLEDTPEDWTQTALALAGLLRYSKDPTGNASAGAEELTALAERLPRWSAELVRQLKVFADPSGQWDPVATAVEVLAIGAALGGRPPGADATALDRLDALFGQWPAPTELGKVAKEWRVLYEAIHRHKETLVEFVQAHASLMKGGARGSAVDAARILPVVRALARDWQPTATPPQHIDPRELHQRYRETYRLHQELRSKVEEAVTAERDRRRDWLETIRGYMPAGTERAALVAEVEGLVADALSEGLSIPAQLRREVDERLAPFKSSQIAETLRITEELVAQDDPLAQLPRFANERRTAAMEAAEDFFPIVQRLIATLESQVESRLVASAGQGADALRAEISGAWKQLEGALDDLGH